MTREDLYGHYRRYYVPSNATLVIVGDVDTEATLKQVEHHFAAIAPGAPPARINQVEPEQQAERRVVLRKPGTTAYFKAAFHVATAEQVQVNVKHRLARLRIAIEDGAVAGTVEAALFGN